MKVLCIFLLLMLIPVMVVSAQGSPFTLYSEDPVVLHGESGDWDSRYTDPGAVFYHDGQFHMFRNGFQAWPASVQIGYLTSPDGLTWTEVTEEPILTTDEVPYAGLAALASSALVEDDGTWVIYFYTWEDTSSTPTGAIGRATADSPLGPWTVHPEPVLTPGSPDSWDGGQVLAPKVTRTEDGYWMYYSGFNPDVALAGKIGLAFSEDGITWEKYDDPTTTETPFAESDPVLVEAEEGRGVGQANVFQTPDGWVMIYRSVPALRQMVMNYATSDDGIHWTPSENNPIWTRDMIPRSVGFWFTDAVYHDGIFYLYIEGGRGSNTDIYVATYEGTLAE